MRFIIALILLSSIAVTQANACSCIWPDDMTVEKHFEETDVVFRGVFQNAAAIDPKEYWKPNREGRFQVIEVLKGDLDEIAYIYYSEFNGANCGLNFEIHVEYEIFGKIDDAGRITTNDCAGTQKAHDRDEWSWDDYRRVAKKH